MGKIKILHDMAGAYGYPVGTILSVEELFRDFRESNECTEDLYDYLCGIPIPYAVDTIAEEWGLDYESIKLKSVNYLVYQKLMFIFADVNNRYVRDTYV